MIGQMPLESSSRKHNRRSPPSFSDWKDLHWITVPAGGRGPKRAIIYTTTRLLYLDQGTTRKTKELIDDRRNDLVSASSIYAGRPASVLTNNNNINAPLMNRCTSCPNIQKSSLLSFQPNRVVSSPPSRRPVTYSDTDMRRSISHAPPIYRFHSQPNVNNALPPPPQQQQYPQSYWQPPSQPSYVPPHLPCSHHHQHLFPLLNQQQQQPCRFCSQIHVPVANQVPIATPWFQVPPEQVHRKPHNFPMKTIMSNGPVGAKLPPRVFRVPKPPSGFYAKKSTAHRTDEKSPWMASAMAASAAANRLLVDTSSGKEKMDKSRKFMVLLDGQDNNSKTPDCCEPHVQIPTNSYSPRWRRTSGGWGQDNSKWYPRYFE